MKNACMWVLLCCALLSGCGNAEEKRSHPAPAASNDPNKTGTSQTPNYAGLIEEYQTLLAEDPNNLAGIIALGNAYFDSGQWKKSILLYDHALLIDPKNADVRTDRGTAYLNIGMPDRALAEYRTALMHEPAHLNARYNMGIVYAYSKKDYKAAIRVWEELLRLSPNYPKAEDVRTAIAVFRKVFEKGTK
jgi:tetratricopeptide (TPR) repeat protein